MTGRDREQLADLAMRAIDTIIEDYGDDAELTAASLVFEVRVGDDEDRWHVNFKSLEGNSPNHIAGLMHGRVPSYPGARMTISLVLLVLAVAFLTIVPWWGR